MDELLAHLDELHTTEAGAARIRKNLSLGDGEDAVRWCAERIASPGAMLRREGKNWYAVAEGCQITVNAHSRTIITAHRLKKKASLRPPGAVTPEQIDTLLENLRRNNMGAQFVADSDAARTAVASLLREGDKIAVGGSQTLGEAGILDLLREGPYRFMDRHEPGLSGEALRARFLEAFTADVFLCSANAVTLRGELYQVDGLSNRIAPLVYGPERVIVVAGVNKVVRDLDAASARVRTVAAPAIVKRGGLDAPCATLGRCAALGDRDMAAGCRCDARRCCNFLVMGRQRVPGRVQVILVGESLGL